MNRLLASLLLLALPAVAGVAPVKWDASTASDVVKYRIYVGTNNLVSPTNCIGWLDVGTNTTAKVEAESGTWFLTATAWTVTAESKQSNVHIVSIPDAPTNFATLAVERSINLTNWMEVYRVKITTP